MRVVACFVAASLLAACSIRTTVPTVTYNPPDGYYIYTEFSQSF